MAPLFAWEAEQVPGHEYWLLRRDGKEVAGIVRQREPSDHPAWVTYVGVDDAGQARRNVEQSGGTTIVEPFVADDAGTVAIFADAADRAVFGVLEPDKNRGAQLVNAPGALTMNQLNTRDVQAATRFYYGVFGWEFQPIEQDGELLYGSFTLGGRLIAGLLPMGDAFPPEVPPFWVPYFGTENVEATAAEAEQGGGTTLAGPIPVPEGRFIAMRDPHGAAFNIWDGSYDPPPGAASP